MCCPSHRSMTAQAWGGFQVVGEWIAEFLRGLPKFRCPDTNRLNLSAESGNSHNVYIRLINDLREVSRIDFDKCRWAATGTNFDGARNEAQAGFSMLSPSTGLNKTRGLRVSVLAREPRAADAAHVLRATSGNGQRSVRASAAVATSQRTADCRRGGLQADACPLDASWIMLRQVKRNAVRAAARRGDASRDNEEMKTDKRAKKN